MMEKLSARLKVICDFTMCMCTLWSLGLNP